MNESCFISCSAATCGVPKTRLLTMFEMMLLFNGTSVHTTTSGDINPIFAGLPCSKGKKAGDGPEYASRRDLRQIYGHAFGPSLCQLGLRCLKGGEG